MRCGLEADLIRIPRRQSSRLITTVTISVALAFLGACTPFGVWVYQDPSFSLQSATLRSSSDSVAGVDSMEFVFSGCNWNDYDIVGEALMTSLNVDGHRVAQGRREQPYRIATRDSAPVSITLAMEQSWSYGVAELPIEVESAVLLRLPKGERRYVLSQKGTLTLYEGQMRLKLAEAHRCRPGMSVLPTQFTRPVDIDRRDQNSMPGGVPGAVVSP